MKSVERFLNRVRRFGFRDRLRRPFDQLFFGLQIAGWALKRRKRPVVFVRFGALGDVIGSLPAVRTYMQRHPGGTFLFVTMRPYDELVARSGLPIEILGTKRHINLPWFARPLVAKYLELYYDDEMAHSDLPPRHFMDGFAASIGEKLDERHITLSSEKVAVETLRQKLGATADTRLVLLHAGPTWKVREWPLEFWNNLAERLQALPNTVVLQTASNRNISLKNPIAQEIRGARGINCDDNLGLLIDTISSVDLLVTVDSGPMHVAAAVNTPCLALFGPTDPALRLWNLDRSEAIVHLVDCSFCHHRRPRLHWQTGCPFDIRCMCDLSPEPVFAEAQRFLSSGRFRDNPASTETTTSGNP